MGALVTVTALTAADGVGVVGLGERLSLPHAMTQIAALATTAGKNRRRFALALIEGVITSPFELVTLLGR
jgi:hypothetical protein